jgi:hypothetical protein
LATSTVTVLGSWSGTVVVDVAAARPVDDDQ